MDGWILAVDIGPAWVVAAVREGHQVDLVKFDGAESMSTVVFCAAGGELLSGEGAVEQARLAPERTISSPRRALADGDTVLIAGTAIRVASAYATLLTAVAAEARRGRETALPDRLVLTHPAGWTDRELGILREAAAIAGMPVPGLVPGLVAVACSLGANQAPGRHFAVLSLAEDCIEAALLVRASDRIRIQGKPGTVRRMPSDDPQTSIRQGVRELLAVIADGGRAAAQLSGTQVAGNPAEVSGAAALVAEFLGIEPHVSANPLTDAVRGAVTGMPTLRRGRRWVVAAVVAAALLVGLAAGAAVLSTGWVKDTPGGKQVPGAKYAAGAEIAYVVMSGDPGWVVPINTTTGTMGHRIMVGSDPEAIGVTPNGKTAYVVNTGSGTVTPISTAAGTAGPPITVGGSPREIVMNPDGTDAFVSSFTGSVSEINITTRTAKSVLDLPFPHGATTPVPIAITPDGKTAYIANPMSNTVTPVDTKTRRPGKPIADGPTGAGPQGIVISPDGRTAYVMNWGSSTVTAITTATNTAGPSILLGGQPRALAIAPDGKAVYVASQDDIGQVTVISTATNTVRKVIPVGMYPGSIVITRDGKTAYVGSSSGSTEINTATNLAQPTLQFPSPASEVAVSPDGQTAYVIIAAVAGSPNRMVAQINMATGTTHRVIDMGAESTAVAIAEIPQLPQGFPAASSSSSPTVAAAPTVTATPTVANTSTTASADVPCGTTSAGDGEIIIVAGKISCGEARDVISTYLAKLDNASSGQVGSGGSIGFDGWACYHNSVAEILADGVNVICSNNGIKIETKTRKSG